VILIVRSPVTQTQIMAVLGEDDFYIKCVVDIERRILAGGGLLHADSEGELLADGSFQDHLWGASWSPYTGEILYESMVNVRPRQNRSMQILDPIVRSQIKAIINELLGGE
jgi:hypothetical protein